MKCDTEIDNSFICRNTTLRHSNEFSSTTEYSNYAVHLGLHRPELKRRGTSLHMEGDFDGRTENNDQFLQWPLTNCRKPDPVRLFPQIQLKGRLNTSTENHDKYVPFIGSKRPEILKQSTHLKLEGDVNWIAEYADVYRDYGLVGMLD
jgi:hypothetical protein